MQDAFDFAPFRGCFDFLLSEVLAPFCFLFIWPAVDVFSGNILILFGACLYFLFLWNARVFLCPEFWLGLGTKPLFLYWGWSLCLAPRFV
jgi:hypothetical protein